MRSIRMWPAKMWRPCGKPDDVLLAVRPNECADRPQPVQTSFSGRGIRLPQAEGSALIARLIRKPAKEMPCRLQMVRYSRQHGIEQDLVLTRGQGFKLRDCVFECFCLPHLTALVIAAQRLSVFVAIEQCACGRPQIRR